VLRRTGGGKLKIRAYKWSFAEVATFRQRLFVWPLGPDLQWFRLMKAFTAPYLEAPQFPEISQLGQIPSTRSLGGAMN
jgi:hypothetical protein